MLLVGAIASGQLPLSTSASAGVLNAQLAAVSAVATGALRISGSLAATLANTTIVATAVPPNTGAVAATLDGVTIASAGQQVPPNFGQVDAALAGVTLAASGLNLVGLVGVLAVTLADVIITEEEDMLQLVSTLTANNTADNLAWTGLTGDDYLLIIRSLQPATNGADINLQFGTGGTPTWITASTYKWFSDYWVESTNSVGTDSDTAAPGIKLANAVDNSNGGFLGGKVHLFGLSSAIRHMAIFDGYRLNGGVPARLGGRGTAAGSTAKTAVRLITSSGNLASGSASLYRIVP